MVRASQEQTAVHQSLSNSLSYDVISHAPLPPLPPAPSPFCSWGKAQERSYPSTHCGHSTSTHRGHSTLPFLFVPHLESVASSSFLQCECLSFWDPGRGERGVQRLTVCPALWLPSVLVLKASLQHSPLHVPVSQKAASRRACHFETKFRSSQSLHLLPKGPRENGQQPGGSLGSALSILPGVKLKGGNMDDRV